MEMSLYPWQESCLKWWFSNHGRGMVQAATGAGKTRLALAAAYQLEETLPCELKVKIVVPTGALMRQWNQALREFLAAAGDGDCGGADPGGSRDGGGAGDCAGKRGAGNGAGSGGAEPSARDEIGMRGSGFKMPADRRYMIYVINSARYELARQILSDLKEGCAVLLIADECHRYESGQNRLIFEFLSHIGEHRERFFSLGLSATLPGGQAYSYLASVLGKRIYTYGTARAAALQNIAPYEIFHISLSFSAEEAASYQETTERMNVLYRSLLRSFPILRNMNQKERFELLRSLAGDRDKRIAEAASLYMKLSYKRTGLVCLAGARLDCACRLIGLLPPEEKILVFSERVSQAEELYRLLEKRCPGRAGRYHSRMGQQANRNTLNRFANGEIRILIACKALDEGLDVPDASIGIILSGTSVQRQRIQRLGRILRKKEGKRASLYYLHITDSAEDACFLPDAGAVGVMELAYHTETGRFENPRYDRAAERLSGRMIAGGGRTTRDGKAGEGSGQAELPDKKLRELQRCLALGSVRSDWLREAEELEERMRKASHVSERNYWLCMKEIRKAAERN